MMQRLIERRKKAMPVLHMLPHSGLGRGSVSSQYRIENPAMVFHRFTKPLTAIKCLEKKVVDRSVQPFHQAFDHFIAGRAHDERMPLRVELAKEFRRAVFDALFHLLGNCLQTLLILRRCATGEIACADAFKRGAGTIELAHFRHRCAAHSGAPKFFDLDQAFRRQPLKRFPHLEPAAARLPDYVDFDQALARDEARCANLRTNPVGDFRTGRTL